MPTADIRRLQDYLRLRADHVGQAASCVQLMQKALERMNVKLHDVISALAGAAMPLPWVRPGRMHPDPGGLRSCP